MHAVLNNSWHRKGFINFAYIDVMSLMYCRIQFLQKYFSDYDFRIVYKECNFTRFEIIKSCMHVSLYFNVQLYLVFIEQNSKYINSFTGRNKKELELVQQVQKDAFHSK